MLSAKPPYTDIVLGRSGFSAKHDKQTFRNARRVRLSSGGVPCVQVVSFYQDGALSTISRYRALVLDSSYRPIDVVSWQRAICLGLFNKVC